MTNEKNCSHKNTIIWEPHLAGARKCKDCGMVWNNNYGYWRFEEPSLEAQIGILCKERDDLIKERDAFEYDRTNSQLRKECNDYRAALELLESDSSYANYKQAIRVLVKYPKENK